MDENNKNIPLVENHKTILLIEDDKMVSSLYEAKLSEDGNKIIVADNGVTGLEIAKKEIPDIILLDIIIPQIDGFSVLEELKKDNNTKNIPVLMLTNLGTDEDRLKGEKMGAVDYVVKASITPAELKERINKYLK